jgi:hypothetical protein
MTGRDEADRIRAARTVLRDAGLEGTVEIAGHGRDVAVVHADETDPLRLAALAPAIKAAGFRYVTIDLAAFADRSNGAMSPERRADA